MRTLPVLIAVLSSALLLTACGSESVSVPQTDDVAYRGAEIFSTHCAGCHTITPAGTQGSGNRSLRVQGPNFDQRQESFDDALFAIHNGGFSGAIMPQNIIVGDDAVAVAEFLAKYSGTDVTVAPRPIPSASSETGQSEAVPNDTGPSQGAGGSKSSSGPGGSKSSSGPGGSGGSKSSGSGSGKAGAAGGSKSSRSGPGSSGGSKSSGSGSGSGSSGGSKSSGLGTGTSAADGSKSSGPGSSGGSKSSGSGPG